MQASRFNEVQRDVASHYATPAAILDDADLDVRQKAQLLKQWEYDLRQMMVASEENMTNQTSAEGRSGETLRLARKAIAKLEAAHPGLADDPKDMPAKTGGAVT